MLRWIFVAHNTTDYWAPEYERCIMWNDSTLNIQWPIAGNTPLLSEKDARGATLNTAEVYD